MLLVAASTYSLQAADNVAWDSSGNGLLNGAYNFREVMWRNQGDFHRIAIYGSIQFDGNGGYTLSSSVMDSSIGSVQSFSTTGAYRISASGMGYLDDPNRQNAASPSSTVWGLVSQGVFIGSSTDDKINNLFVAAQAPSSPPANSSFSGSYRAVAVNFPSSDLTQARDMFFPLNPDGQGSLGSVNLTGFVGPGGITITQTLNGAVYSFADQTLTLGFGGSGQLGVQTLIGGSVSCYLSADGNFFFGGSATGWDMIVGVRAYAGIVPPSALSGKYYQAGADVAPAKGFHTLATYYGAFNALPDSGVTNGHQRILNADPMVDYNPYDYTYSDVLSLAPDGTHEDFIGLHYVVGAGGAIQIGYGNQSRLGINIAVRAPDFSGPGVYLKPTGIANAGSSAPFTVGVSRGGFLALYGSNLSPTTLQDENKPFSLGGVQVLINNRLAPIRYVRSDVVLAVVPYATTGTVASIQVINNGVASDIRTVRVKNGTPGVYTSPAGGIGYAVAQHVEDNSYSTVTPQNPARPGETILVYLTGLGDVNPAVPDGVPAPGPPDPLAVAVITPVAVVDGETAVVGFAGLTPTLIALYAMHVTIPADIAPGDVYLDISLPDSYTSQVQIPIGTSNLPSQSGGASVLRSTPSQSRTPAQIPGTLRRFPGR
jgi:uncharacterized protein (TIGR03437 family)